MHKAASRAYPGAQSQLWGNDGSAQNKKPSAHPLCFFGSFTPCSRKQKLNIRTILACTSEQRAQRAHLEQ